MDVGPSESSGAAVSHRVGQACDRCRKKKLKCDGTFPICRRCETGGHLCEASTTLRRKTKVRGFASDEKRLEQLQAELAKCQQLLQSEKDRNELLQEDISLRDRTRIPEDVESIAPRLGPAETVVTHDGERSTDDPAYVIKHMGRLVHDGNGVGRFAGSTTGVHFVLSVEKECQKTLNLSCGFSESCFRLFLVPPSPMVPKIATETSSEYQEWISECLHYPLAYYHEQADLFTKNWEAFCPVLVRTEVLADIDHMMGLLADPSYTQKPNPATALMLLMLHCINDLQNNQREPEYPLSPSHQRYLFIASGLTDKVAGKGDMRSLQALVLFGFYSQLSGDCLAMTRINGLMVRISQSLGLHRHARRFKMKPGEIELGKRVWWYVYVFDSMTSLLHGLPALINDVDVDNDLPSDCYLLGLDSADISHPLPGENTAVFVFIQYVRIGKILSRIREMLYTTTKRRNGVAKIKELDLDLQMWSQSLKAHGIKFEIGALPTINPLEVTGKGIERTTLWLQLLANIAMVFIHRPGLSFDESTSQFANCLRACVASSSAGLALLENTHVPRWLQNLSIMGPAVVFQSGLMHVYYQCLSATVQLEGGPSLETSLDLILKGRSILEKHIILNPQVPGSRKSIYHGSISEVIGVLDLLHSLLVQKGKFQANTGSLSSHDILGDPPVFFDGINWGTEALDVLNYVTAADWAYDIPGPLMGYPELETPEVMMENTHPPPSLS